MITLDDIRAFLAVAKHESFVKASEELFITPPAMSRRIKKLEEFVGGALFERTTQMVAITPSGQVLLERAEAALHEFEAFKEFASHFAKDDIVKIRFACMWSTAGEVVPGLIRDYIKINESCEFMVQDGDAQSIEKLLKDRKIDFGISMRPDRSDNVFRFEPLCEDPIMLACPPKFQLYNRSQVTWEELQSVNPNKYDWGVLKSLSIGEFSNTVHLAKISLMEETKISHLNTQINFLDAHLRAIIMPRLGISLSRARKIRAIPITEPELKREIGILSLRTSHSSMGVCSFVQHIREHFLAHYDRATAHFTL